MREKLRLNRIQISSLVGDDPDAIRVIERLIDTVNTLNTEVEGLNTEVEGLNTEVEGLNTEVELRLHERSLSNTNYSFDGTAIDVRWTGDGYTPLEFGLPFGSWNATHTEFTFSEHGVYRIDAVININSSGASARSTMAFRFLYSTGGGWNSPHSWSHGYARDVYDKATAISQFLVYEFNAGDVLKSEIYRPNGSASLTTATNGSHICLQKIG
jgi:hypothetical protein